MCISYNTQYSNHTLGVSAKRSSDSCIHPLLICSVSCKTWLLYALYWVDLVVIEITVESM